MKFNLTQEQLNNLKVFLDRVTLKGLEENQAFMDVLIALSTPIKEEEKQPKGGE